AMNPHRYGFVHDRRDDRNSAGGLLGSADRWWTCRHDNIHRETDQVGHQVRKAFESPLRPLILNGDVLVFLVARLAQPFPECREPTGCSGWRIRPQKTDVRHLSRRLRVSGMWRCEQAQDERDDAPDGAIPHDRLLKSASCRPSCFHGSPTLRFRRRQWPKRGTSEGWRRSGATAL